MLRSFVGVVEEIHGRVDPQSLRTGKASARLPGLDLGCSMAIMRAGTSRVGKRR
jgi:hypothetical protein